MFYIAYKEVACTNCKINEVLHKTSLTYTTRHGTTFLVNNTLLDHQL